MILGEFGPIFSDTLFTQTARNRTINILLCRFDLCQRNFFKSLKEFCSVEMKDFLVWLETTLQAQLVGRIKK